MPPNRYKYAQTVVHLTGRRRTWIALADGDIHQIGLATMPQEPGTGGIRVAEAIPASA